MTYAIVARDPIAGEIGGAVQTHFFNAGAVVLWPEAGTGMVATMAMAETAYGRLGLRLLRHGQSADAALAQLLARDSNHAVRQVAILGVRGTPAAHTGASCIEAAGHHVRADVVALGNMLARAGTWDRMTEAFGSAPGSLASRLLDGTGSGRAGWRRHPRSTIRGGRRRQDCRGSRCGRDRNRCGRAAGRLAGR